jgi:hypothetical protein
MSFPQPSDYRPPIIPDGEVYDNPENGRSYYWTQILLPEGSTPDTATSIGGYWTVVCEDDGNKYLLRHGDTVDDLEKPAEYIWNDDVQFESTGLKGVLLPKEIEKSDTDEKHITNKEYVDTQDGILASEADARSEFLCAHFFKVLGSYSEVEKADGHVIAEYNFGPPNGRKYWTRPPQPGFFANGEIYYINDQGPYELEQVTEENKWVTFFINGGPTLSLGSYASFSKTRKLCTEINLLQNDVIELEEEINAIAPSVERGQFISTTYSNAPRDGEFMLSTLAGKTIDYGDPGIALIQISKVDNEGVAHTYADAEAGQLLQFFEDGNSDYGLYLIEAVAGQDDAAMTAVTFTVSPVSGFGEATEGDLARLKIFSAPSGGTADGFVLKTGDTMTGELEFYHEQSGNSSNYNTPSAGRKDIRFTTKNTDNGVVSLAQLYQPGYSNTLVCSGGLVAKSNLYTNSYLYGLTTNSNGTAVAHNPRIYLRRSTNSSGSVTSEYGSLQWGSSDRLNWYSTGGSIRHGGTIALEWTSAGISKLLGYNGQGSNGQVLRLNSSLKPYWSDPPMPTYTITKSNGNYYVQ